MPLLHDREKSESEKQLFSDWIKVRAYVNEFTGHRPDINAILFLIGMTEYGDARVFSKEEKEDLMHIGMCRLFENELYRFTHQDEEGWPHFEQINQFERINIREQENLIKERIVIWFKKNELI